MNRQEAFRHVTGYWAEVAKAEKQPPLSGERRALVKVVNEHLPMINKILRGLGQTSASSAPPKSVTISPPGHSLHAP